MRTYVAFTWTEDNGEPRIIGTFMSEKKAELALAKHAKTTAEPTDSRNDIDDREDCGDFVVYDRDRDTRHYQISMSVSDLEPPRDVTPRSAYLMMNTEDLRRIFEESIQSTRAILDKIPILDPPIHIDPLQLISETSLGSKQMRNRSRVIEHVENCMEWGGARSILENSKPDDDRVDLVCKAMVAHLENHKEGVYDKDKEYAEAYIREQAAAYVERWLFTERDDDVDEHYNQSILQPNF